jgi:acyl-CoA synthetase (AMP-forming)/AMP-acid ligase II
MRVGSGVRAIPSGSLVADAVDEVEDVLTVHPEVAVVGEPDEEMGQQVVAVVEPAHPERAGTALGAEPQAWCRGHLAGIRCPRQVPARGAFRGPPAAPARRKLAKHRLHSVSEATVDGDHG